MNIEDKNIDELLIAFLLKELDQSMVEQVEQWISATDENQERYHQIKKLWDVSEDSNLSFDSSKAWNKVSPQISQKSIMQGAWLRVAAAIILLVGSYFVFFGIDNTTEPQVLYANSKLESDTLTDGSIIKLNNNSNISYAENFNTDVREISLEGEAFFDIERDTTKAFIINIENSRVEVLGTSFNINTNPDSNIVTVNVRSGLVAFSYLPEDTTKAYQSIQLKAGEKVSYNKDTRLITESKDSLLNKLEYLWIDKQLVFDGIRLEKVVEILEVVYDVNINFSDDNIKDCLLTVSFDNEGITQIIEVIASTFDIDIEQEENNYLFKNGACENQ